MKLNKDQIQQVEDYLSQKGLKYIDVRYEVLDHMVTDIEEKIISKHLSFKDASEIVYLKWSRNFTIKSSFWIGWAYGRPKIFIDKSESVYKKTILKTQLITISIIFIAFHIIKNFGLNNFEYDRSFKYLVSVAIIIGLILTLYWFITILKTKLKTSYSFLFTVNILPTVLIFTSILFGFRHDTLFNFEVIIILSSLWSGKQLYKNHMKNVSLYSSILAT